MADLEHNSIIGGRRIIHQGIADQHTHDLNQIIDIGEAAFQDVGAGGGLIADTLSGFHFSDLEEKFINVDNNKIDSVILNNDPTISNETVTLNYLKTVSDNYKDNDFLNITILGDINDPIDIQIIDNYNISFPYMEVLIGGKNYKIEENSMNLVDIEPLYKNKTFYIYLEKNPKNNWDYRVDDWYWVAHDDNLENSPYRLKVGTFETNSNGISGSLNLIQDKQRVGLNHHMIRDDKQPHSLLLTDSNGKIDYKFLPSKHSGVTTIEGDAQVNPNQTYTYQITNYNSFANYYVNVSEGYAVIDGDLILYSSPSSISGTIVMEITKNSYTTTYNITS